MVIEWCGGYLGWGLEDNEWRFAYIDIYLKLFYLYYLL